MGREVKRGDIPRIGAVVGKKVIPISISDDPEILSRDKIPQEEAVLEWVRYYHKVLMLHWNGEITDYEVLAAVSKPVEG